MPSQYARPEILAETEWLAGHLDDPAIRIVDCDEFPAYQRLHIRNAVGLRVHHYLKDPENPDHLMPPDMFEGVMSAHGIGDQHTVVSYDSMGGLYAARLWWALDYYGHRPAEPDKVLNGGFRRWLQEGRPVTDEQPHVERAVFTVKAGADSLCSLQDMRDALNSDTVVIWDVRSRAEYTGDDPRQNRRGGHVPGAVHMEWLELTAPPARSGLLLPADEIARKLQSAGITPEKTVYAH